MNPILPRQYFTPDVEAHVMPDGRLYLYGSNDLSGHMDYCSCLYHVYSTADPALGEWVDHGISFRNDGASPQIPWNPGAPIFAPDAIHYRGKYYLYICCPDGSEAVAVADRPQGPFGEVTRIAGAEGIDPAVFVDDDGQAYYLWGQFSLNGARLAADMRTLVPQSVRSHILTEQEHGFHEGSSLRKINGRYYIVYTDISRGRATCLSYAVADHPLGPYKKGGVIIDNTYCDPESWNNHGSIEMYNGRLYVFYHRSSQNSRFARRVCVEPLQLNSDGSINEVVMTCNGAGAPLDAEKEIDAARACRLKGNLYITPDPERPGQEILTECGGGNWTEAWAEYRYLDCKEGMRECRLRASGHGKIILMAAGGDRLGETVVNTDGAFMESRLPLSTPLRGVQAVWLLFDGQGMRLDAFRFAKDADDK